MALHVCILTYLKSVPLFGPPCRLRNGKYDDDIDYSSSRVYRSCGWWRRHCCCIMRLQRPTTDIIALDWYLLYNFLAQEMRVACIS